MTNHNFTCEQGATFSYTCAYKDNAGALVDLTGYTARMQVRTQAEPTSPQPAASLELTTANGRITLGGAAGTIVLLVTASDTAAVAAGTYAYDLELVQGATVYRLLEGDFVVTQEVTR